MLVNPGRAFLLFSPRSCHPAFRKTPWGEAQESQLLQAPIKTLPPSHQLKLSLLWAPISHLHHPRTLHLPDTPENHLLSWVSLAPGFAPSEQTKALSLALPNLPGPPRGSDNAEQGERPKVATCWDTSVAIRCAAQWTTPLRKGWRGPVQHLVPKPWHPHDMGGLFPLSQAQGLHV